MKDIVLVKHLQCRHLVKAQNEDVILIRALVPVIK